MCESESESAREVARPSGGLGVYLSRRPLRRDGKDFSADDLHLSDGGPDHVRAVPRGVVARVAKVDVLDDLAVQRVRLGRGKLSARPPARKPPQKANRIN